MAAWRYEISLLELKIFHSFAALTHEIFFNTRREISCLRAAMSYPLYKLQLHDRSRENFD